jgi:hypothetical protein
MTVWFATNTRSLKVRQLRADPRVTLYYADHAKAIGYVALTGRAALVDDMAEIQRRKRAYWDTAFPGLKHIVLIRVVPERIEVIHYARAAPTAIPDTWRPPTIAFPAPSKAELTGVGRRRAGRRTQKGLRPSARRGAVTVGRQVGATLAR